MKTSKLVAVTAAVALAAPVAATAGNLSAPIEENVVIALPEAEMVQPGSLPGSLRGSLAGPAAAALIALLVLGAAGAGGGS